MRRLRQITAVIEQRQKAQRLHRGALIEWQTKTLASFIAATVPVEKGKGGNPLAKAAEKVRLRLEDDEGVADNDVPMEVWLEEGSQTAENSEGSFEQLMRGFGG